MKRNVRAPIPTGAGVLDVQSVTGWRGTHLRTAFLASSCFCGSFLLHHSSFFFSPNLWNHDRYNRSTVQFLLRVQWVWKCLCRVVSACLSAQVLVISALLQVPNRTLLLAGCAACIGGTFQYGYNVSVINAPTKVNVISVCRLLQERGEGPRDLWFDSNATFPKWDK